MKRSRILLLCAVLIAFANSVSATTCVWGKKFKTHKVCGVVRDFDGVEMPDAMVRVEKPGTEDIIAESKTTADGTFALPDLAAGDYVIRVKSRGFVDATQSFRLVRPHKSTACRVPIRVVMDVAGRCSGVENAFKQPITKPQNSQ